MESRKLLFSSLINLITSLSSCLVLPDYIPDTSTPIATSVELSNHSVMLQINGTYSLKYTLNEPESNETIIWKPMDTSIVTISQSGTIQAGQIAGKTKIIITCVNRSRVENLEDAIDVTVVPNEEFFITNESNELIEIKDKAVTSITLPEKLNDRPLVTIATDAFKGCSQLETLNIPNGVKNLNDHCFDGLASLKNLLLPATLEYYGVSYGYLNKLENVFFASEDRYRNNNNKYRIGDTGNFIYQQDLIYIDPVTQSVREYAKLLAAWGSFSGIPVYVGEEIIQIESLGEAALYGLRGIKKALTLPVSIREIGKYCFAYSTIPEVSLPSYIEKVEYGAFANAIKLEKISTQSLSTVPNSNNIYVSDNGVYYIPRGESDDNTLIAGCNKTIVNATTKILGPYCFEGVNFSRGNNFIVQPRVTKICKSAFRNNPNLTSIEIPESVIEIEEEDTNNMVRGFDVDGNVYEDEVPDQTGPFYLCDSLTIKVPFKYTNTPAGYCNSWNKGIQVIYDYKKTTT